MTRLRNFKLCPSIYSAGSAPDADYDEEPHLLGKSLGGSTSHESSHHISLMPTWSDQPERTNEGVL